MRLLLVALVLFAAASEEECHEDDEVPLAPRLLSIYNALQYSI